MTSMPYGLEGEDRCCHWLHPDRTSGKVVIVFDDLYLDFWKQEPFANWAWGLDGILKFCKESPDIMAVAIIDLPDLSTPGDTSTVMGIAQRWLKRIEGEVTGVRVLVDMYRGSPERADLRVPVGLEILRALQARPQPALGPDLKYCIHSAVGAGYVSSTEPWLSSVPVFERRKSGLHADLIGFLGGEPIEHRLWPLPCDDDGGDPAGWLDDNHPIMKHNWQRVVAEHLEEDARRILASYLRRLLGFSPPRPWMADGQIIHLWNDLKHMIGPSAIAHGGCGYNLTLGNLVLLFGTAVGAPARPLLEQRIVWRRDTVERSVLPLQTSETVRRVVAALAGPQGVFRNLLFHDENGSYLVNDIAFTEREFSIRFDLDIGKQEKAKESPPLIEQVRNPSARYSGVVYRAIQEFIVSSSTSLSGSEVECVLDLRPPEPNGPRSSVLEFRKCRTNLQS